MDEIIHLYRKLIDQLDDEYAHIALCLEGELLLSYRKILNAEKEKLEMMIHTLSY